LILVQGNADTEETPEGTTEAGLRFIESLRNAKDKQYVILDELF
jgi:hypothetical protein